MNELDDLHHQCEVAAAGGAENVHGKVNILLQSHISRIRVEGFSLVSDANYVTEVHLVVCVCCILKFFIIIIIIIII